MSIPHEELRDIVWRQMGAAIDMLENAIVACPEEVWGDQLGWHEFWYIAFHTLFWTDLYLSDGDEGFASPTPFGLEELTADQLPPRIYTKQELLAYLDHVRRKALETIAAMDAEGALRSITFFGRRTWPRLEVHLYNTRHVQHHAAQLNLLLRQRVDDAPKWVGRAKTD